VSKINNNNNNNSSEERGEGERGWREKLETGIFLIFLDVPTLQLRGIMEIVRASTTTLRGLAASHQMHSQCTQ
jgi:hypothetical protein